MRGPCAVVCGDFENFQSSLVCGLCGVVCGDFVKIFKVPMCVAPAKTNKQVLVPFEKVNKQESVPAKKAAQDFCTGNVRAMSQ